MASDWAISVLVPWLESYGNIFLILFMFFGQPVRVLMFYPFLLIKRFAILLAFLNIDCFTFQLTIFITDRVTIVTSGSLGRG